MFEKISKKEFYKMILRDRLPIARMDYSTKSRIRCVELYRTPLGTLLLIKSDCAFEVIELKMYDRMRSSFEIQNVFCGDNLVSVGEGQYIAILSSLQIEDVIGRDFLIRIDNMSILARAEMLKNERRNIDKMPNLVYN